jgi:hypothetical protein
MHTLGHNFVPDPIHAGGLRYHGMAPLVRLNLIEHVISMLHESVATWHAGPQLCISSHPCGWPALPRHGTSGED